MSKRAWNPAPNPELGGLDVLITAGQHDSISPLEKTRSLVGYLEQQAANVALELHPGGHEVTPDEVQAVASFLKRT